MNQNMRVLMKNGLHFQKREIYVDLKFRSQHTDVSNNIDYSESMGTRLKLPEQRTEMNHRDPVMGLSSVLY